MLTILFLTDIQLPYLHMLQRICVFMASKQGYTVMLTTPVVATVVQFNHYQQPSKYREWLTNYLKVSVENFKCMHHYYDM